MFNLFLLESLYRSFGVCVLFGLLRTRELLQFSPPNLSPGTHCSFSITYWNYRQQ